MLQETSRPTPQCPLAAVEAHSGSPWRKRLPTLTLLTSLGKARSMYILNINMGCSPCSLMDVAWQRAPWEPGVACHVSTSWFGTQQMDNFSKGMFGVPSFSHIRNIKSAYGWLKNMKHWEKIPTAGCIQGPAVAPCDCRGSKGRDRDGLDPAPSCFLPRKAVWGPKANASH